MGRTSTEVKKRYNKRVYTRIAVSLHKENDADILERLDKEPSKQGFFKKAAREKIERENIKE